MAVVSSCFEVENSLFLTSATLAFRIITGGAIRAPSLRGGLRLLGKGLKSSPYGPYTLGYTRVTKVGTIGSEGVSLSKL
jgi:hypothetical protein